MSTAAYFRSQAQKCRSLSRSTTDQRAALTLRQMADEYEEQARALEPPDEMTAIIINPE